MTRSPHGRLGGILLLAIAVTAAIVLGLLWGQRHFWVGWLPALTMTASDHLAVVGSVAAATSGALLATPLTAEGLRHRSLLSVRHRAELTGFLLRWHMGFAFGTTTAVTCAAIALDTAFTDTAPVPVPWLGCLLWAAGTALWIGAFGLAGSLLGHRFPHLWAPLAAAALAYLAHLAYTRAYDPPAVAFLLPLAGLSWQEVGPTLTFVLLRCLVAGLALATAWFLLAGHRRLLVAGAGIAAMGTAVIATAPFMPAPLEDRPTATVCTESVPSFCAPDWAAAGLSRYASVLEPALEGLPDSLRPDAVVMTAATASVVEGEDIVVVPSVGGLSDATALPEPGPTVEALAQGIFLQACGQAEAPHQLELMHLWLAQLGYTPSALRPSGLQSSGSGIPPSPQAEQRQEAFAGWDADRRQAWWKTHEEEIRTCTVTANTLEEISP